jgi:hypothetical protein
MRVIIPHWSVPNLTSNWIEMYCSLSDHGLCWQTSKLRVFVCTEKMSDIIVNITRTNFVKVKLTLIHLLLHKCLSTCTFPILLPTRSHRCQWSVIQPCFTWLLRCNLFSYILQTTIINNQKCVSFTHRSTSARKLVKSPYRYWPLFCLMILLTIMTYSKWCKVPEIRKVHAFSDFFWNLYRLIELDE